MDHDAKPVLSPSFAAEEFDGELLLYSEQGEQAFYLNDAAQAVLQLCDGKRTVAGIIDYLQGHYPDQRERIERDVVEVIGALDKNGVITLAHE